MSAEKSKAPFTDSEMKAYLGPRRVIVASAQASAGKALRKAVMQYGAKSENVLLCENYEMAAKELAAAPTHLLATDFRFSERSGLDLIEIQESKFPSRLEVSTLILSGDPSGTTTGTLVDANVDALLVTPFTAESIRKAFVQALANRVKPSEYWKVLENGKELLRQEKLPEAVEVFKTAQKLDQQPTLSFYYVGLIHGKKGDHAAAAKSYTEGLEFNPQDYRCLAGLFETRMATAEYPEAYKVAVRMHETYPVSVKRILELVRLSIYMKKFSDVVDYYQIFKQVEQRDPMLCRVVVAGMLVCAKYFMLQEDSAKCLEVLKEASQMALKTETLRLDAFRYFIETGNYTDGERFYNELPEALQKDTEGSVLYLELLHASDQAAFVLKAGTEILRRGIRTPRIYALMIENSQKMGRDAASVDRLVSEASSHFPKEFSESS